MGGLTRQKFSQSVGASLGKYLSLLRAVAKIKFGTTKKADKRLKKVQFITAAVDGTLSGKVSLSRSSTSVLKTFGKQRYTFQVEDLLQAKIETTVGISHNIIFARVKEARDLFTTRFGLKVWKVSTQEI